MTPEEQAKKIKDFITKFDTLVANTFEKATENLATDIHHRVFDLHEDVNGEKLGQYSTKPTLIGAKSFANQSNADSFFSKLKSSNKKAKGQRKKAKGEGISFVNEDTDTGWRTVDNNSLYLLMGGYKELREIQGRPTGEINLQYSFELATSGLVTDFSNDRYVYRFANQKAIDKGRGFEETHGKRVFYPSDTEKKTALDYISVKLIEGLKECFN